MIKRFFKRRRIKKKIRIIEREIENFKKYSLSSSEDKYYRMFLLKKNTEIDNLKLRLKEMI
ncbi:MAG: hypothetical protein ACRC92_20420 [Peptostreptococcaceae bacterium]